MRQASRMPTSPGHFLCLHLLLSLLVTFFLSDQTLHRAGDSSLYGGKGVAFTQPKSRNPREGSDWPSVGHMPIFRPVTAVRGWDIMIGSPHQKHVLRRGGTDAWKEKEVG